MEEGGAGRELEAGVQKAKRPPNGLARLEPGSRDPPIEILAVVVRLYVELQDLFAELGATREFAGRSQKSN